MDIQPITSIVYNSGYESVIGLLTSGTNNGVNFDSDIINTQLNIISYKGYSDSYNYEDGSIGVVFTSKYIKNINKPGMIGKIAKYILQLERDRKINTILN